MDDRGEREGEREVREGNAKPVQQEPLWEVISSTVWMLNIMLQAAPRNVQDAQQRQRGEVIRQLSPAVSPFLGPQTYVLGQP